MTTQRANETASEKAHGPGELPYKDTHHRGLDQVHALVARGGHNVPPDRVAELMTEHPADAKAIHAFVQQKLGNGYWKHVEKAMTGAKKANHVNVGFTKLNEHDQGYGTNGADPNRMELHDASHGPKHGIEAHVATETAMYKNDGTAFEHGGSDGKVAKGRAVDINTGAYKTLHINGTPTECVFGFRVLDSGQTTSGWIPVDHLDAHGQKLGTADKKIAHEVAAKHEGMHFVQTPHAVHPKKVPASIEGLRLAASTARSHDTANLPEHYYGRNSIVNLLANVPNAGTNAEKKYGIANDVLASGTKFYRATSNLEEHVQLYEAKSDIMTSHQMTFVYGKAEAPGQPASYGWINKDCLA